MKGRDLELAVAFHVATTGKQPDWATLEHLKSRKMTPKRRRRIEQRVGPSIKEAP